MSWFVTTAFFGKLVKIVGMEGGGMVGLLIYCFSTIPKRVESSLVAVRTVASSRCPIFSSFSSRLGLALMFCFMAGMKSYLYLRKLLKLRSSNKKWTKHHSWKEHVSSCHVHCWTFEHRRVELCARAQASINFSCRMHPMDEAALSAENE